MQIRGMTQVGDSAVIRFQFRDGTQEKVMVPCDQAIEFLEAIVSFERELREAIAAARVSR